MAIDPAKMRKLEGLARELGPGLDDLLNPVTPKQIGFCILLFSFDGSELSYISNAERADMIKCMEEILTKFKVGKMTDYPGGIDARG